MKNATEAKDIAIYFLNSIEKPITSSSIARSINNAYKLQLKGFSHDWIISAIDFYTGVGAPKGKLSSLAFLLYGDNMQRVPRERNYDDTLRCDITLKGDSGDRNRLKVERHNSKSGVGKASFNDLFK